MNRLQHWLRSLQWKPGKTKRKSKAYVDRLYLHLSLEEYIKTHPKWIANSNVEGMKFDKPMGQCKYSTGSGRAILKLGLAEIYYAPAISLKRFKGQTFMETFLHTIGHEICHAMFRKEGFERLTNEEYMCNRFGDLCMEGISK